MVFTLVRNDQTKRTSHPLLIHRNQCRVDPEGHCDRTAGAVLRAASNRAVMEAIIAQYKEECGREVQVQFGPSQTLLSSLEVSGKGDLFLPADSSYVDMAKKRT